MSKDEKGSILAFTLAVMSLLFLLAASMLMLSSNTHLANTSVADRINAFYLAEAGATYGRSFAHANWGTIAALSTDVLEITYAGEELLPGVASPSIKVERDASGNLQLVSSARVRSSFQVVRAVLSPP